VDNVVAIAALARGHLVALGIGLVVSIIILLIGSALVAMLIERFPNLIILSGFVLAWISADLIIQDTNKWLPLVGNSGFVVYLLTFSFVFVAIFMRWTRARRLVPTPTDVGQQEAVVHAPVGIVQQEDIMQAPALMESVDLDHCEHGQENPHSSVRNDQKLTRAFDTDGPVGNSVTYSSVVPHNFNHYCMLSNKY